MSELEPIEFEIKIDASVLIDHIPILDVEEKFIETYVSAEELSQCNRRSINAVEIVIGGGCDSLEASFNSIIKQLKFDFESNFGITQVFSAEPVIASPYILNNGEVRLYGESNIIVKIKSAKWDEFYRLVEQIVGDAIARAVDDDKIGTIYEILL